MHTKESRNQRVDRFSVNINPAMETMRGIVSQINSTSDRMTRLTFYSQRAQRFVVATNKGARPRPSHRRATGEWLRNRHHRGTNAPPRCKRQGADDPGRVSLRGNARRGWEGRAGKGAKYTDAHACARRVRRKVLIPPRVRE